MEYKNFNIRIETNFGDGYQIQVDSEGMGEAEGVLKLSPECLKIAAQLREVVMLDDSSPVPLNLGTSLYQCLFDDRVGAILYRSLGAVIRDDEKGLRIRLKLSPPEIAALPWEVLYDTEAKSFLCTSEKTPLTRYIELSEPIKALKITPPVKVLVLIPGGSGLDVEKEERLITEALGKLGTVQVFVLRDRVTRSEISQALVEDEYHILHFIGHGTFQSDEGHISINSDTGGEELIAADVFAGFFRNHPSLKLAVLNSCQGAEVSSTKDLAGMAPQLVLRGIPAVVAMQYPISDTAALTFAREFYLRLCSGWSRGQVDTAISHARNRIKMDIDEPMAFATPVLFLRSPTGIIFDLEQQSGIIHRFFRLFTSAPVKNVNRLKDVKRTYENNIEAWQEKAKDAPPEAAAEVAQAIEQEQAEIRGVEERIVRWNRTFAASIVATSIIFFMGYAGLFNIFHADDWLETKFIPYMDEYVTKRFNSNVRLIMAEEGVNGEMGLPDRSWRPYHAALVDSLSGRAKVIVFDLEVSVPTDQDGQFAEAIKRADAKGTHVVLAKKVNAEGATTKDLAPELRSAINDRWGNIDVGGQHWGFVRVYQLAQAARDTPSGKPAEVAAASLALEAVAQFLAGGSKAQILVDADKEQVNIYFNGQTKSIPAYQVKPAVYDLPYDLVDYAQLKDASRSYRDVYMRRTDSAFLNEFDGRIVIVGFKKADDEFHVTEKQQRYGTEIHANVISNILNGVYVHWLPTSYDLLIVGLLAATGALVKARFSHVFSARITLPFIKPSKRVDIPGLLFLVDVIYLLTAFLIYKYELTYILRTYHLVTPFIAYWLTGRMRGRVAFKPLRGNQP